MNQEKNSTVTRFDSLQAGRGLAAIMVVLYHCEGIISLSKYWHGTTHYFHFGARGVDFFFVLSGIVILHAHRKDIGRPTKIKEYCWKRFRRIYPIYWVVLICVLPAYFLFPSFGNGFETRPYAIVQSLLLLPFERMETIIPVAWTLYHEVMFYLVFVTLLWRKALGIALMTVWMSASVVSIWFTSGNDVLSAYLSPLHLLFGFGLIIAVFISRASIPGLALALMGICGFSVLCYFDDVYRLDNSSISLFFGLFAGTAATGLMLLEKHRKLHVPNFLIFLGEASYSIYLIHYTALSASAKLVHKVWLIHPVPLWIPAATLAIIALISGIALHVVVERPLLQRIPRNI